jgi:hypothetical protein
MATLVDIYSTDEALIREISDGIGTLVVASEPPAPADAPAALDLDLAALGGQLWQFAVAFGALKSSIEAVELIVQAVRSRHDHGVDTEIELALASGEKVKFSGRMTPEQAAAEIARFRQAMLGADTTPS